MHVVSHMVLIFKIIKYLRYKFNNKDDYFDDDRLLYIINKELENQESGLWSDTHPYTEKIIELNKWTEENIYSNSGDK